MPKRKFDECDVVVDGGGSSSAIVVDSDGSVAVSISDSCCTSNQSEEPSCSSTESRSSVSENEDENGLHLRGGGRRRNNNNNSIGIANVVVETTAEETSDSCTTEGSTEVTTRPRSSLKKNIGEPSSKKKRSIEFNTVTVYYFHRMQGFTCVPSQGGSTLGMANKHSHVEKFSLSEHANEQHRVHRDYLLKQRRINKERHLGVTSDDEMDEDEDEDETDISDSELDLDNYYFLQPVPTRQRRAMLRASGVRKIESVEKDDCRSIRASREFCGCECKIYCDPETCTCSLADIKCQVDRLTFPCGCTRDGCGNRSGRIEFNPIRVRTHFIHTLMRLELEKKQQQMENTFSNEQQLPALPSCQLQNVEQQQLQHQQPVSSTNHQWNLGNSSTSTSDIKLEQSIESQANLASSSNTSSTSSSVYFASCGESSSTSSSQCITGAGGSKTNANLANRAANFGLTNLQNFTTGSNLMNNEMHISFENGNENRCRPSTSCFSSAPFAAAIVGAAAAVGADGTTSEDDDFHGREDSLDMYGSSFQDEEESSSYSENSDYSEETYELQNDQQQTKLAKQSSSSSAVGSSSVSVVPTLKGENSGELVFPNPPFSNYTNNPDFSSPGRVPVGVPGVETFHRTAESNFDNHDNNFVVSSGADDNAQRQQQQHVANVYNNMSNCLQSYHSSTDHFQATCNGTFSNHNDQSYVATSSSSSTVPVVAVPAVVGVVEEPQSSSSSLSDQRFNFEENHYTDLSSATCMSSKLEPFTEILQAKYRNFQSHDDVEHPSYEELILKNGNTSLEAAKVGTHHHQGTITATTGSDLLDCVVGGGGDGSGVQVESMESGIDVISSGGTKLVAPNSANQIFAETTRANSLSSSSATSSSDGIIEPGENFGEIIKKTMVETVSA